MRIVLKLLNAGSCKSTNSSTPTITSTTSRLQSILPLEFFTVTFLCRGSPRVTNRKNEQKKNLNNQDRQRHICLCSCCDILWIFDYISFHFAFKWLWPNIYKYIEIYLYPAYIFNALCFIEKENLVRKYIKKNLVLDNWFCILPKYKKKTSIFRVRIRERFIYKEPKIYFIENGCIGSRIYQ